MKIKKGILLLSLCALLPLSGCASNSCDDNEVICPVDEDEKLITPREYEDKDKTSPVYSGEEVLVTSIKKNENGDTYIEYNGLPLAYRGVQIRTDAFMNTDKWSEEDLEVLFKSAKETGFNLVEVPLEWADVEIEKDVFDFYYVFKVLEYARKYDLKVEFLWFGTNMCGDTHSYTVPDYILRDGKTYPKFDAPRTGEFWSYYGIMWYLDFSNPNLLQREGNALTKVLDFIYDYDSTHGATKSVVGFQVHNEADIFARWRIFTNGKEVIDPSTKEVFKKEDAFKHAFKALDNLGKTIKSHKYKVITRCNIATGTKGDADGEYSGIYENSGELKTIRSFIKEMQSLEGIDIVGDDSYNATLKDNKGILMMYKNQLNDNYPHIAENDGNYQNTPSLLITSAVVNGGYLVYELATSPFFKKNNASDIDQGIYSVNADKTLTPKKHESSIKDALSILNLASTPLGLAKNGNILGFNLKTDSPLKVTNQTINSENISVNVNIDNSAIGYAVDYKNSLYLSFSDDVTVSFENATIKNVETGIYNEANFVKDDSVTLSSSYSIKGKKLYKFDYENVLSPLVSNALSMVGE